MNKHEEKIQSILAYCHQMVADGFLALADVPTYHDLKKFNACEIAEYSRIFSDRSL